MGRYVDGYRDGAGTSTAEGGVTKIGTWKLDVFTDGTFTNPIPPPKGSIFAKYVGEQADGVPGANGATHKGEPLPTIPAPCWLAGGRVDRRAKCLFSSAAGLCEVVAGWR